MNREELETFYRTQLIEQPGKILKEELALIEMMQTHAKDINFADIIKTGYKSEASLNKSFKNEREEKASVEIQLKANTPYQELLQKILNAEKDIKIAQANLAFQRDCFRAYLAIAGMMSGEHK